MASGRCQHQRWKSSKRTLRMENEPKRFEGAHRNTSLLFFQKPPFSREQKLSHLSGTRLERRVENDQQLHETVFGLGAIHSASYLHCFVRSDGAIRPTGLCRTRRAANCGRITTTGGAHRPLSGLSRRAGPCRCHLSGSGCRSCGLVSVPQLFDRSGPDVGGRRAAVGPGHQGAYTISLRASQHGEKPDLDFIAG